MSLKSTRKQTLDQRLLPNGRGTSWVRPTDWLTLPSVASGDQKIVALVRVAQGNSNFVAFTISGAYTVDWGDGSALEDVSAGVAAEHNIQWADVDSGTLTSEGFRQAIVVVTMQGGQTMTSVNLNVKHSSETRAIAPSSFLDIAMAGSSISTLLVGVSTAGTTTRVSYHNLLKKFDFIGSSSVTNMSHLMYAVRSVRVVSFGATPSLTDMGSMFSSCYSLELVSFTDTSAVTSMASMFSFCTSLQAVSLFDTSSVTNMSYMFTDCYALTEVPHFDTSNVELMEGTFAYCRGLASVPHFDTSSVTNMSLMFTGCSLLREVPLFNTALVTDMSSMFDACRLLQTVPLFNTAAVLDMTFMFDGCSSLQSVPLFNTGLVTSFEDMFYACSSLEEIPALNTTSATNQIDMANFCYSLQSVSFVARSTIGFINSQLSASALNTIYTNAATVTAQTMTVTGNWGTASDNPSIATAKGWTVTG